MRRSRESNLSHPGPLLVPYGSLVLVPRVPELVDEERVVFCPLGWPAHSLEEFLDSPAGWGQSDFFQSSNRQHILLSQPWHTKPGPRAPLAYLPARFALGRHPEHAQEQTDEAGAQERCRSNDAQCPERAGLHRLAEGREGDCRREDDRSEDGDDATDHEDYRSPLSLSALHGFSSSIPDACMMATMAGLGRRCRTRFIFHRLRSAR
jgi:hypothetical protein